MNNMLGNLRILDANINRCAEGIRVVEDIARFKYENEELTTKLRNIRHFLRKSFYDLDKEFILARDSVADIGREISQGSTLDKKKDLGQIVNANFKRVTEALRTIEEISKIIGKYDLSKQVESKRYEAYYLEKELNLLMDKKKISDGLYGITCERFANGKSNVESVQEMIKAGIKTIQYREKDKKIGEKLKEAKEISKLCKEAGVTFIVNDHIDIAILVDADGVHVGQDDMPIKEVRNLIGNDKIIGLSTHSSKQAKKAVEDGADYIGVGPIFPTTTKDTAPVGLEYLEYVINNLTIPYVAIGGIKEHNIEQVIDKGAKTVCLVSEIVGADDVSAMVERLNNKIKEKK